MAAQMNETWISQGLSVINSSELDWAGQCEVGTASEGSDEP